MSERPHLQSLADRAGILSDYFDIQGARHFTTDETRLLLLTAMGLHATSEASAHREMRRLDELAGGELLAPVCVIGVEAVANHAVELRVPDGCEMPVEWELTLVAETGETESVRARFDGDAGRRSTKVPLPFDPGLGYHGIRVTLRCADEIRQAEQLLIVAPACCFGLSEPLGRDRALGVWSNLYSVRSRHNWGVGDLSDVQQLAQATAGLGADFLGLSPLHALSNRGYDICPYAPVSRLFRNYIYLDIEAVPELTDCPPALKMLQSPEFQESLARARSTRLVEYERVAKLKSDVLQLLHATFLQFHGASDTHRSREYARFVRDGGPSLRDFAAYSALADQFRGLPHDRWPAEYQHPAAPAVEAFRAADDREIGYYCYVQFELDRQLAAAADAAQRAGMSIGLYNDLALGSAAAGSDAWSQPDLFARAVHVGAPPDPFNEAGQIWGFPPIIPHRLTASNYAYWRRLVAGAMRHCGMLRVDHVMGLFRQFWVPLGRPAHQGAYVRYPTADLLGILALESHRNRTIIVGEDLGTVPPEVPATLAQRAMLSSRVLWFEQDHTGFRPPHTYTPNALVTATTHDLPPLAGLWSGRDLEWRRKIGLIDSPAQWDQSQDERERARSALWQRLVGEGLVRNDPSARASVAPEELCAAVYAFLARTPSRLVGVALDDLAGETMPVNLPGITSERFPNWSRRMQRTWEVILADVHVVELLRTLRATLRPTLPEKSE